MLSSVTINCQVTKIVMKPGSQLSELGGVLKMSLSLSLVLEDFLFFERFSDFLKIF